MVAAAHLPESERSPEFLLLATFPGGLTRGFEYENGGSEDRVLWRRKSGPRTNLRLLGTKTLEPLLCVVAILFYTFQTTALIFLSRIRFITNWPIQNVTKTFCQALSKIKTPTRFFREWAHFHFAFCTYNFNSLFILLLGVNHKIGTILHLVCALHQSISITNLPSENVSTPKRIRQKGKRRNNAQCVSRKWHIGTVLSLYTM